MITVSIVHVAELKLPNYTKKIDNCDNEQDISLALSDLSVTSIQFPNKLKSVYSVGAMSTDQLLR